MSYTLIIDTSTEKGLIVLANGPDVHSFFQLQKEKSSDELFEAVKSCVSTYLNELKVIAVAVGPGSFTGVRVGVAFAKGLSSALQIPLISLCSLEGFVSERLGPFASLIDARSQGAYVLLQERRQEGIQLLGKPTLISKEKLEFYLSCCIEVICPSFNKLVVPQGKEAYPNAERLAEIAHREFITGNFHHDVFINYLN